MSRITIFGQNCTMRRECLSALREHSLALSLTSAGPRGCNAGCWYRCLTSFQCLAGIPATMHLHQPPNERRDLSFFVTFQSCQDISHLEPALKFGFLKSHLFPFRTYILPITLHLQTSSSFSFLQTSTELCPPCLCLLLILERNICSSCPLFHPPRF